MNVHNWWECSGEELWVMNLRWSNFLAHGDKYDHRGGKQGLNKSKKEFSVGNVQGFRSEAWKSLGKKKNVSTFH